MNIVSDPSATDRPPMTLVLRNTRDTEALGTALGQALAPGSVLLLVGPLGSGKTTLVKGVFEGLGGDPSEVLSPSFTLLNVYSGGRLPLRHLDLYRLDAATAASDPDVFEALSASEGITAVEWADKLPAFPGNAVLIHFTAGGDHVPPPSSRRVEISGLPPELEKTLKETFHAG